MPTVERITALASGVMQIAVCFTTLGICMMQSPVCITPLGNCVMQITSCITTTAGAVMQPGVGVMRRPISPAHKAPSVLQTRCCDTRKQRLVIHLPS